ncbi:MAG: quaternary amine ABC transporter ATP-binding protein [Mycobacteriaceae bacterium]|uniref:quaternary amine ABC transporter ATP-binding protein n=1 Tax=Corynebacterium sp. TaxID=1720 RepID=UPI003F99163E
MSVVSASHVYKVFGKNGPEVVRRLEQGADRSELAELGTPAVIDANFTVEKGEIFVVMGLSGSGKSTLIRMINGLWKPTSGSIEIAGKNVSDMGKKELRELRADHISMVFQHFALLPHRTVRENAAYALEIQGVDKTTRLEKGNHWLHQVGLEGWGDSLPGELSGGMQQRVGLARALAAETDILLMDEAFSALDPLIRTEMQDQLIELQRELQKTIIFISHDLNEAMRLGDRIAIMRGGRIAQTGTATEILTNPADEYISEFIADVDRSRVLTAKNIMSPADGSSGVSDLPTVEAKTVVSDLFALSAKAGGSLAVVEHGSVIGVVDQNALVSSMTPAGAGAVS